MLKSARCLAILTSFVFLTCCGNPLFPQTKKGPTKVWRGAGENEQVNFTVPAEFSIEKFLHLFAQFYIKNR